MMENFQGATGLNANTKAQATLLVFARLRDPQRLKIMRLNMLLTIAKRAGALSCSFLLSFALAGCGGHSSTSTSTAAKVNVTPTTASISPNQVQAFSATAVDSSGNTVSGVTFGWTSSTPAVASIDAAGIALGRSTGTTQITASTGGVTSAASTLNVTQPIASITVSPRSATIAVNGTQPFTATALDAHGSTVNGVVFSWACSFSGTATIDANGVATGVAPGTVTIVASASGIQSAPSTLTVTP